MDAEMFVVVSSCVYCSHYLYQIPPIFQPVVFVYTVHMSAPCQTCLYILHLRIHPYMRSLPYYANLRSTQKVFFDRLPLNCIILTHIKEEHHFSLQLHQIIYTTI